MIDTIDTLDSRLIRNPDIRVLISGLQTLSFRPWYPEPKLCGYYKACEVKVLKVPGHELRIFIDEIAKQDGTVSQRVFSNIHTGNICLHIEPRPHRRPEVWKYMNDPFDADRLEREAFAELVDGSIAGSDDPHDYRWVIDLEGKHFYHNVNLIFDEDSIASRIWIPRGQFYTAARTAHSLDRITVRRRGRPYSSQGPASGPAPYGGDGPYGGERKHLGRVARVIGANIVLEQGKETACLRARYSPYTYRLGCEQRCWECWETLFKFDTCNYTYKVAIVNLHSPYGSQVPPGSDFQEYYYALAATKLGNRGAMPPEPTKYDLFDMYDLAPSSRSETDEVPCAPTHGGTGTIKPAPQVAVQQNLVEHENREESETANRHEQCP